MNKLPTNVLLDFHELARELHIRYILVGAGARLMAVQKMQKEGKTIRDARATMDLDFGVQLESHQAHKELCDALEEGVFSKQPAWQRFLHEPTGIPLDIVPFGRIALDGRLEMDDGDTVMSTLGFDEALERAVSMDIEGASIPVVDDVGFVILKLIAWKDRRKNRDLLDVWHVMNNYDTQENMERIWDEYPGAIADGSLEIGSAYVRLLGADIGRAVTPKTHRAVAEVLQELAAPETMHVKILARLDQTLESIAVQFGQILTGITETYEGPEASSSPGRT